MAQASKYTADEIQVLEGLEPVRRRPGMYIGGTGKDGYHHLLWEIVDNSIDEVINKHASRVEVTLHKNGKSATVEETAADGRPAKATFVLDAGVIKDTYTLAYEWTGDERVEWQLVGGGTMLKSQVGSYTLKPTGSGTEVVYRLTVELKVPMLGMFKRKAEKVIIDTALKGLKKRVES